MLRRRGERGAAAVEFALVLPVLLLLLFGIIDFGRMLNAKLTLTTAAREGARAVSLIDAAAGRDRIGTAAADLGTPVTSTIIECPQDAGPDDDASVTVRHEFTFVTPINVLVGLGGSAGTVTLTSTSIMPCLG